MVVSNIETVFLCVSSWIHWKENTNIMPVPRNVRFQSPDHLPGFKTGPEKKKKGS